MQYRFIDSTWDQNSIACFPFYHDNWRERDIVEVLSPESKRIGFIICQSVFFTDDRELLEKKALSDYLTTWLKDYLKCQFKDITGKIEEIKSEDNLCYLLLHKKSIEYLDGSTDAINAFMFSLCFSSETSAFNFLTTETVEHLRNRLEDNRVKIFPIFDTEASKYFLLECIPRLHMTRDPFSQFILLYQFFEVLMEILFAPRIKNAYDLFSNKSIGKNDFREKVSKLSKESSLLTELLSPISTRSLELISEEEKIRFVGDSTASSVSDIVYQLRNTIFHRTRLFLNHEDFLKKINYVFLDCIYECMKNDLFKKEINDLKI
jgi:hypothetical protein